MSSEKLDNTTSDEEEAPKKLINIREKIKGFSSPIIITTIAAGVLSAFFSGVFVYYRTKEDNRHTGCIQAIRTLDINNYKKKDLAVLNDECKDELNKYELFSEILFDSNDTNKFSSNINQLYVDDKIDESTIIGFSDIALFKKINSEKYNFDNVFVNEQNNLPKLKPQIAKYLEFTKEILFQKYDEEQKNKYFYLFSFLFEYETLLSNDSIPPYIFVLKDGRGEFNVRVDPKLLDLQKIAENMGKVDKHKFQVDSKNIFVPYLLVLFNSYKNHDNKDVLIKQLSLLSSMLEKNAKMDKSKITNDNQWEYINKHSNSVKLVKLVLLELSKYDLGDDELKNIFDEYIKISAYAGEPFSDDILSKLVLGLFVNKFKSNGELYRELFFKSYKNKKIALKADFINYLAVKEEGGLLMDILKINPNDKTLKRQIFEALLIGDYLNLPSMMFGGYDKTLISMLKDEKDLELQRALLSDILTVKKVDILEYAMQHIRQNKTYYLKKLNDSMASVDNSYTALIFKNLADNKPQYYINEKELQDSKTDLLIEFMLKTDNKDSKLRLLDNIIGIIGKNDFSLVEKLRKAIYNERDSKLRQEMLNRLAEHKGEK